MLKFEKAEKALKTLSGFEPTSTFELELFKGVIYPHGRKPGDRLINSNDEVSREMQVLELEHSDISLVSDLAYTSEKSKDITAKDIQNVKTNHTLQPVPR